MVEIATVTVFWNSLEGLANLIPSMYGHFKAHVFIDGIYKNFPMSDEVRAGNGLSTDGSREYIWDCDEANGELDTVPHLYLYNAPFKTEYEKRSMYLDAELLIKTLDVDAILILDTDEYIGDLTDWEFFYKDLYDKI